MQEDSNQHIEPEAFTPVSADAKQSQTRAASAPEHSKQPYKSILTWSIPALLLLLAVIVVIFPFSKDPVGADPADKQTTSGTIAAEPADADTATPANSPKETPWADAQLLKARRDAQEILSELLGVQKRLESIQVETWAADKFEEIRLAAEEGDGLYKERKFEESLQQYSKALDLALYLDVSVPDVALQYQNKGKQLLQENLSEQALNALQLSDLLMPDTEATLALMEQAQVREQILSFMEQSQLLARNETELEQARQRLAKAKALDASFSPLDQLIEETDRKIMERDFRQYMSEGFNAMGSGHYQQATGAFKKAAQLKPDDRATIEALQQVEAAKLNTKRQASINKALEYEAGEQWEAALTTYSHLLDEDASLTAAQLGKLRSQARFNLDSNIQAILESPLSLQSERKWQTASKTLSDARGIINAGERLNAQIKELQKLLVTARTPVVLKIQSDGLTDVEIYKVGKLGSFTEQAMNLNPGEYVIVGRRNGYQDVRVDLVIDGSKVEITVPVICTTTI